MLGPNRVTPMGMTCKWSRILENSNINEILNDIGFELKAEEDLASVSLFNMGKWEKLPKLKKWAQDLPSQGLRGGVVPE
jgi:hypothetical protein